MIYWAFSLRTIVFELSNRKRSMKLLFLFHPIILRATTITNITCASSRVTRILHLHIINRVGLLNSNRLPVGRHVPVSCPSVTRSKPNFHQIGTRVNSCLITSIIRNCSRFGSSDEEASGFVKLRHFLSYCTSL